MSQTTERNKKTAVAFLKAAAAGRPRAAAGKAFAPGAVHHNPWFPAGMGALIDAMEAAPKKTCFVKHAIAQGDLVAVHSHVAPRKTDRGFAVVHLFRFRRGKVVEFWDVGLEVPKDSPNADGVF